MSTASRSDRTNWPTLGEAVLGVRLPARMPGPPEAEPRSKYHREIKPGVFIDVYDVLKAFDVRCGALQHLIKKALAAGQRGHKDLATDMDDIVKSAIRARELAE